MALSLGTGVLSASFVCGVLGTWWWWRSEQHRAAVSQHIFRNSSERATTSDEEKKLLPTWLLRLAESAAEHADSLAFHGDNERIARMLLYAGHPYKLTQPLFGGVRIVALAAGMFLGNFMLFLGFPALTPFFLMAAGFFGPYLWLKNKAQDRQNALARTLPDFLDTVSCALDSGGVGLDQAIDRTLPFFKGALSEELSRWTNEVKMGVPRQEALNRLIDRTSCRELQQMAQVLIQAEKVGGSIVRTFVLHATSVREHRAVQAQKRAARVESTLTLIGTLGMGLLSLVFIFGLIGLNVAYNPAFSAVRSLFSR